MRARTTAKHPRPAATMIIVSGLKENSPAEPVFEAERQYNASHAEAVTFESDRLCEPRSRFRGCFLAG
jgi:hypothetical protein